MLSVAEVWSVLDSLVPNALPAEPVPLSAAQGRVLREAILAPEDQPAFDRSAIDGYVAGLQNPAGATLRLAGEASVGRPAPPTLGRDEALRLFTGSPVPAGPFGLVMREDVSVSPDGGSIRINREPSAALIRRRASQARAGDTLLEPGARLGAGSLALLASVGAIRPLLARRPRVAHLITGGEIVPPDATPEPGEIRDSNSALIAGLVADAGGLLVAHERAGEDQASAVAGLARLLESSSDVVLVSGGSSVGEHDHTARVLAGAGFDFAVRQVASRPGKPLLVATRGAQIAFGLPGNPLSHFVCFHLFVARVLARLLGTTPAPLLDLPLAPGSPLRSDPRETWWPATRTATGYAPLPWADSSDLTSLARTHALLRVPSAADTPETCARGILV